MKIYEIGTGYTPIPARIGAATELVAEELTRAFRRLGLSAEILDMQAEERGKTDLPIREIPVPRLLNRTDISLGMLHKLKRVVYSLSLAGELSKLLKTAEGETVLHFHNQYNLFFYFLLVPKKRRQKALIAYTVHSGIWRRDWKEIEKTVRKRYFQEALCIRKADLVFVLNEETMHNAAVKLKADGKKIVITRNGVNPSVYRPLEKPRQKLVLQVGSVCENKGQLRSAQLLLPLMEEFPDLIFAYAGGIVEEDYHAKIRSFAARHGLSERIRYLGMIAPGAALNEVYCAAAVSVMNSGYEAFGLAAIEALAAGTPVLLSRESRMNFGEGCIFCDAAEFAQTLRPLLTEEHAQLREAARRNAVTRYSWEKIAAEHAAAFTDRMKET